MLVARPFDVSCNPFCPVLQHSIYSSLTNAYCTCTGAGTETVTLSTSGSRARAQHATTITPHMCQPQGTECPATFESGLCTYVSMYIHTYICKLDLVIAYGAHLSSTTNRKNRGCCIQQEKVVVVVIGMAGLPAPMQHIVSIVQLIAWFSWSTAFNDTHRARYRPP